MRFGRLVSVIYFLNILQRRHPNHHRRSPMNHHPLNLITNLRRQVLASRLRHRNQAHRRDRLKVFRVSQVHHRRVNQVRRVRHLKAYQVHQANHLNLRKVIRIRLHQAFRLAMINHRNLLLRLIRPNQVFRLVVILKALQVLNLRCHLKVNHPQAL